MNTLESWGSKPLNCLIQHALAAQLSDSPVCCYQAAPYQCITSQIPNPTTLPPSTPPSHAGWHDRYCTDARYFICKLPNPPLVGNTTKPTSPSPGNNGTDPTTPANPGSDNKGDLSKLLPSVLVPVLTGLGALATISYTAWKWYHKRKAAKMAAEKLGELGGAAPSMGAQSGSMPSMGAQSASAQSMGGGMSNGGASGYGSVV